MFLEIEIKFRTQETLRLKKTGLIRFQIHLQAFVERENVFDYFPVQLVLSPLAVSSHSPSSLSLSLSPTHTHTHTLSLSFFFAHSIQSVLRQL